MIQRRLDISRTIEIVDETIENYIYRFLHDILYNKKPHKSIAGTHIKYKW